MIGISLALIVAQASPIDRSREGDWAIADSTDNNTGKREVYAFQMLFPDNRQGYLKLTMRCSNGEPTFFIDWPRDTALPEQAVVSIGSIVTAHGKNPPAGQFIFAKSEDVIETGYKASPASSAQIVSTIGSAPYASFTVHLPSSSPSLEVGVEGTQQAWRRIVRHCPVQQMPMPTP